MINVCAAPVLFLNVHLGAYHQSLHCKFSFASSLTRHGFSELEQRYVLDVLAIHALL